jgi:hypothetical protein
VQQLATIEKQDVTHVLGSLSPMTMQQIEGCIKAALEMN